MSETKLLHADITDRAIRAFYLVYNHLGHGFLESVYHNAMRIALAKEGLHVARHIPINVFFLGENVGRFQADLLVNSAVLLELKSARCFDASHEAQTLNYLRATPIEVGLLMNFGPKPEFKRFAYANERKRVEASSIDASAPALNTNDFA